MVFHRCGFSCGPVITMDERMPFHRHRIGAIGCVSVCALPKLALIHRLCHNVRIFALVVNPSYGEFVCVAID